MTGPTSIFSELAREDTLKELTNVRTPSGAFAVGNARSKFRDGFASLPVVDPDTWLLSNPAPDTGDGQGHIVNQGGNSAGAAYLRISLSPFLDDTSVLLTSKQKFRLPTRVGFGVSVSQRIAGQTMFVGLVEASDTDPTLINRMPEVTPVAITGATATISNNTGTFTAVNHGLRSGDRVIIVGCADKRLNVGPVQLTVIDRDTISVPVIQGNTTFSSVGGSIRHADPLSRANNGLGLLFEQANNNQASFTVRRNGAKYRLRTVSVANTASTQAHAGGYADALVASANQELFASMDECSYRSYGADSNGGITGIEKYTQSIPDEELDYRLHIRVRTLDAFTKLIARVVSIAKTGTTTATVTTDRPHGVVAVDRVGLGGFRDTTNFPFSGDLPVLSVISPTQFTVNIGPATTVTDTTGGVMWSNQGGVFNPGVISNAQLSTISRTGNVLVLTSTGPPAGVLSGEYVNIWGLNGPGAAAYEGAYRVLRISGNNVEVEASGPDFAAITTSGIIVRRSEVRLHFVRVLDHTRHFVEVLGGRGNTNDTNNSVPITIVNSATIPTSIRNVLASAALSTTVVSANGNYTQTGYDTGSAASDQNGRSRVLVMHTAGQTHGHLTFEQSNDGTTYRETYRSPVPSDGAYHLHETSVHMRFTRWRFFNGTVTQTAFFIGHVANRSETVDESGKTLLFPATPNAGVALAANASQIAPRLDLGVEHKWDRVRAWAVSDQAGTLTIQQSMDDTTWFAIDQPASPPALATNGGFIESRITMRYVRAVLVNGAAAATGVRLVMALVS
jgi:hypothetical protein